jgi:hypothetical protein
MKARKLLDGASFDPPTLKVVGAAFDAAWEEFAFNINIDDPVVVEARLALADAVLAVADEESRDVAALKKGALEVLARKCAIAGEMDIMPEKPQ